ncbi:MAG: serine/threonine protein kinase [Bradymonadia bacterium]|jgi:serine/threonine protein kinase
MTQVQNTRDQDSSIARDESIEVSDAQLKLEGYQFLRRLGKGGQAETWLANDANGHEVTIKVYDFQRMQSWKENELVRRELETLKQLRLRAVPRFIDFIETNDKFFLVMEYIAAHNLQALIDTAYRPTSAELDKLLLSLAKTLSQLHSRHPAIIHRDIKPSNILVDDDFNAYLIDFGVVASYEQHTLGSTVVGSVGYMAPELMMGRATAAVDIYSLGATLVHLVTGRAPHTMEHDGLELSYHHLLPPNLSPKFRSLLQSMLQASPKERCASGTELLNALNQEPQKNRDTALKAENEKSPETTIKNLGFLFISIMLLTFAGIGRHAAAAVVAVIAALFFIFKLIFTHGSKT